MNAAKDTEKEVDWQGIDIEPKKANLEPQILKADLTPEEWMELRPRVAETTNLVGSVSKPKPNAPIVCKRKRDDEKAEARVTGSHFLQPLASESHQKTGIHASEPAALAEERTKASEDNDESPEKIVELNIGDVESLSEESVHPGEEGTGVITEKDVLCGRGGAVNAHRGNKMFRDIVDQHRRAYLASRKTDKPLMNRAVVRLIRQEGGRFLKCKNDGLWYEIGDFRAHEKVGQAFRQKAPEMRKLFFNEELPLYKKVRRERVRQALQEQQRQQLDELQRQQQQHLEEIQKQQRQQELQLALARAGIGTLPVVDPSTLAMANPLLLQQAMTNPVFYPLLSTNQVIVPIAPVVNQALQTLVPVGNNAATVMHLAAAPAMGNGGLIPPRPLDNTNAAVAPTSALPLSAAALAAAAAAASGNGSLLVPKSLEGP